MSVTAEQIMLDAEAVTGAVDWGGPGYFEGEFRNLFSAMVHSALNEARLHTQGLLGAELRLRAMAEARLRFIDDRRRHTGISAELIKKPVFILGLPRAGSTFLHSLLALDPANRNPQTWEMMMPSPPPEQASYSRDPRIDRVRSIYRSMGLERPELTALHPFGAQQAEECHLLMELTALGDFLPGLWRMSSYNKVRAVTDLGIGYQIHRMALQNLQYRFRGERWVLKNPGHVFYLDQLLAVYPDARIIQTHRDPAKVMPSVAALLQIMRQANSDDPVDGERIALGNVRAFATGLAKAVEFRQRPGMNERFHDVHFRQLIAEPMKTVQAIYRQFGLNLSSETVDRMEHWLTSQDAHTAKAKFTLAQFGLDEAKIHSQFAGYMNCYGIAPERTKT